MEVTDLEIAFNLERQLLGPTWHLLSCGCRVHVRARLPGTSGIMNLHGDGDVIVCEAHILAHKFRPDRVPVPKTWMHWYMCNLDTIEGVTREQFQDAFDEIELAIPFREDEDREHWSKHPSDHWIIDPGTKTRIYRTGAMTEEGDAG